MADELILLRIIPVMPSPSDRAMFREAAAAARVPIELVENDGETAGARQPPPRETSRDRSAMA